MLRVCGHVVNCAGTPKTWQGSGDQRPQRLYMVYVWEPCRGGVYNRMGADLDGIVLALRRPGMHLHWEYSVCFSSPLLGKAGEIKADASYIL